MSDSELLLEEISSVPNLRAAVGESSSGDKLLVFSSDPDRFHIASADGMLEAFGGITVSGPQVSAQKIDPNLWLNNWLRIKGLKFGSDGWGQVGASCKLSVTFTTGGNKNIVSVDARWVCTPVPE